MPDHCNAFQYIICEINSFLECVVNFLSIIFTVLNLNVSSFLQLELHHSLAVVGCSKQLNITALLIYLFCVWISCRFLTCFHL